MGKKRDIKISLKEKYGTTDPYDIGRNIFLKKAKANEDPKTKNLRFVDVTINKIETQAKEECYSIARARKVNMCYKGVEDEKRIKLASLKANKTCVKTDDDED